MRTDEHAELSMRVKALEADVAELQRKLTGVTGAVELLIGQVEDLRKRANLSS
jgi:hypothetical protein